MADRHLSLTVSCLLPLLACGGQLPTSPAHGVPIVTVVAAQSSGIDAGREEVIRDPEAWERAWREIHARRTPAAALPAVDFSRQMLLLVALGERPDGCHDVEIAGVERAGDALRVTAHEIVPGPGCICTMALVQPVHVVGVERAAGEVRFAKLRVERACG